MDEYLDEIPQQLAARRAALAAARADPALLGACRAIEQSVADNLYTYLRHTIASGCVFPDRPVSLSADQAAFLTFGTTPSILRQDLAWIEAGPAAAAPADTTPSAAAQSRLHRHLTALSARFGRDQAGSRVYNFEPWVQEMYRDCLDVDQAEEVRRRLRATAAAMDQALEAVRATGLEPALTDEVVEAFGLFQTITGSIHRLQREKKSFVDRRAVVATARQIDAILERADGAAGAGRSGRSPIRALFDRWKNANYEHMALTRQLRRSWAGTSLDDRVEVLLDRVAALQKTLERCPGEGPTARPQLPAFDADADGNEAWTRQRLTALFHDLILYDPVAAAAPAVAARDLRRFGPLTAVIVPGSGRPRFCRHLRQVAGRQRHDGRNRRQWEGATDLVRRSRYSLNCLVVPLQARASSLATDLAAAWLEYAHTVQPESFREFLLAARSAVPSVFVQSATAPDRSHRRLARLVAAFAAWARCGDEPAAAALPEFAAFRTLILSRLRPDDLILPIPYQPLATLFLEAGAGRRREIWKRVLGPRYDLDRQLLAAVASLRDVTGLADALLVFPPEKTRRLMEFLTRAGATTSEETPASRRADAHCRRLIGQLPDCQPALAAVAEEAAATAAAMRRTAPDRAEETIRSDAQRRLVARIRQRRLEADRHIDQYLVGLLHVLDGNLPAAEQALVTCLGGSRRPGDATADDATRGEADDEKWLARHFPPSRNTFTHRPAAGDYGAEARVQEFLYYNLGMVYQRLGRWQEAAIAFREAVATLPAGTAYLHRLWAERHLRECRAAVARRKEAGIG
ncbi:MAG: tetratricopeptide repeat protein [Planctomycetes bacterium]|nr:tetratricopeptide repeat protein [Planctomycetota bacterium]